MEFNLADLWECVADTVPSRLALVAGDTRLTFAELEVRANRLASGLRSLGVGPGDHVGVYLRNCAEHVEALLACYKLRAVPANLNYRYVAEELAFVLADGDMVGVITSTDLAPVVAAARASALSVRWELVVGSSYESLVAAGSGVRDFEPRSGDDHYLLYTGGTTGRPKGVVWRQEDIFFATLGGGNPGGPPLTRAADIGASVLANRVQRLGPFLPAGDPGPERFVSLALGPLMHASGQWSTLGALLGGGTSIVYTGVQMDMSLVLSLVAAESVCMLTLVGDTSGRPLASALEADAGRTSMASLRLLGSGGSILSGAVKARLLACLPNVVGITEAVGSSEAPVQGVALPVTLGGGAQSTLAFSIRPETVVFDESLVPVQPGSGMVGRLATSGRVPLCYYNDPVKSASTFVTVDGVRWSMPGDMATVAADGTIRLLGRGSLCINTGGEKVYPEEVEAVVKDHAAVSDAVIVGVPDAQWGERVVAVVSLAGAGAGAGAGSLDLDDLQAWCRARVAGYKVPKAICIVDTVRRSPSGKADYGWAREVATAAAGAGATGAAS